MSIYDASVQYREAGVPLVVLAGKEYGSGSSRDWAAKGTMLLGVKAVIAESFERIHRSNLVNMGVLPLEFVAGDDRRVARPDRAARCSISSGSGATLDAARARSPCARRRDDGTRRGVRGARARRHARGADGVPARRHPAVRAAAARAEPEARRAVRPTTAVADRAAAINGTARDVGFDLCGIARAERHPKLARLADVDRRGPRGRHDVSRRLARRAARLRARACRRRGRSSRSRVRLQHRPAVLATAVDAGARGHRALRLGRRLSRRAARPAARAGARGWPTTAGPGLRGVLVRRRRAGAGARVRRAGGPRLDRQEHLPDQPAARVVDVPRRDPHQCRARARRARRRSVRHVHAVPRRVSDRRDRRAVRARCDAVPVVPDDRDARRASTSMARARSARSVFGCDICQDVCPWNRRAATSDDPAWQPRDGARVSRGCSISAACRTRRGARCCGAARCAAPACAASGGRSRTRRRICRAERGRRWTRSRASSAAHPEVARRHRVGAGAIGRESAPGVTRRRCVESCYVPRAGAAAVDAAADRSELRADRRAALRARGRRRVRPDRQPAVGDLGGRGRAARAADRRRRTICRCSSAGRSSRSAAGF